MNDEIVDMSVSVGDDGAVCITDGEFELYFEADQWDEIVDEVEDARELRRSRMS